MKQSYSAAAIIVLLLTSDLYSQIVLSEIMFDPLGSDSHEEFVEIVNIGSDFVELAGWQVNDGFASDNIIAWQMGQIVAPGQTAVILDPSYFANSQVYDDIISAGSLVLTLDNTTFGSRGLSNSAAETVSLVNPAGAVVSRHTYTLGNEMGISEERIDLYGPDSQENWADSKVVLGTPGGRNSVALFDFDLAVLDQDLSYRVDGSGEDMTISVTAKVRNVGSQTVDDFSLAFYEDSDRDTLAEADELLANPRRSGLILTSGDSASFSLTHIWAGPGEHTILVQVALDEDENLSNNLGLLTAFIPYAPHSVIINEIMYSPFSGQAEWVELYNQSLRTVALNKWAIADDTSVSSPFRLPIHEMQPGAFLVIAQDSSLLSIFPLPNHSYTVVSKWPRLNNTFDSVVLYDPTDREIDRVSYRKAWGGEKGISLEKIDPRHGSNDSLNWNSSVDDIGATPGRENSIFANRLPIETALTVEPNPFTPDGDGSNDSALIEYALPISTSAVNVKIYDLRGRLVRFLANNRASGARGSLVWDGRDRFGNLAPTGIYIVFLQAINASQGLLKSARTTVVLAGNL